jgi:hypothetical protein
MKITDLKREGFKIVCQTAEEFESAADCYNRALNDDAMQRARCLVRIGDGEAVTVEAKASSEYVNKGGGFGRFSVDVTEWIAPYFKELKARTGCDPFAVDLTSTARRITHTHITEALHFDGATASANQVLHVYGYSNDREITPEVFEAYGLKRVKEYIGQEYGKSYTPPEFEEVRGGLYKRNHGNRQTTYTPEAINEKLWQFIFGEWLSSFATDGQKELIKRFARVHRSSELYPSLRDSHRSAIHLDNYHATISWEDFRAA